MRTLAKLKLCDWALLIMTLAVVASAIQLEILSATSAVWVWAHIILCIFFMGMCAWHIQLHFHKSNWFAKIRKQKSPVTRLLWWMSLLTLLTGIIASIRWIVTDTHGSIGAVHGKIGFLMVILTIAHLLKRKKFFSR